MAASLILYFDVQMDRYEGDARYLLNKPHLSGSSRTQLFTYADPWRAIFLKPHRDYCR